MSGSLASINVSPGGVPKTPVTECHIGKDGLAGDRQRDLSHHGGPDRAVCLYSTELIEALRGEGHAIAIGSAGENLTLSGLDWRRMVPGRRLKVGAALLELTKYAHPCRNLTPYFRGGDFGRISQKVNPGWGRLYARVLEEGRVRVGDGVEIVDALRLDVLPEELSVARLAPDEALPQWATSGGFFAIVRTADELSIVCPAARVPESVKSERGLRALAVRGPLAFELTGILASLAVPLADAGVSIFAVSTYDTDYVLVREGALGPAIAALRAAGHAVSGPA